MSTSVSDFAHLPPAARALAEEQRAAAIAHSETFTAYRDSIVKRTKNVLDPESQASHDKLLQQMLSHPPKPASVINLHPWALQISGVTHLQGIRVPPCAPGQPFAHHHIRHYQKRWEYKDNGSGALEFFAILPIEMAAEFRREFSQQDNGGCGVLIYEGDSHPSKMDMVETYDALGKAVTVDTEGYMEDQENNRIPTVLKKVVKAKLKELIEYELQRRNNHYFSRIELCNSWWKEGGKSRAYITTNFRLMAEVLLQEGILPVMPDWNQATRLEMGLQENNCPKCGKPTNIGAYACGSCGKVLDPFRAFMNGDIEYGHVSLDAITDVDKLLQIDTEQAIRLKARQEAKARMEKAQKKQ